MKLNGVDIKTKQKDDYSDILNSCDHDEQHKDILNECRHKNGHGHGPGVDPELEGSIGFFGKVTPISVLACSLLGFCGFIGFLIVLIAWYKTTNRTKNSWFLVAMTFIGPMLLALIISLIGIIAVGVAYGQ